VAAGSASGLLKWLQLVVLSWSQPLNLLNTVSRISTDASNPCLEIGKLMLQVIMRSTASKFPDLSALLSHSAASRPQIATHGLESLVSSVSGFSYLFVLLL
jgi:hypothetical protein